MSGDLTPIKRGHPSNTSAEDNGFPTFTWFDVQTTAGFEPDVFGAAVGSLGFNAEEKVDDFGCCCCGVVGLTGRVGVGVRVVVVVGRWRVDEGGGG